MVLAFIQNAAVEPGLWAWVQLIASILFTPAAIGFLRAAIIAYRRGKLGGLVYSSIDAFKASQAAAGKAEEAKGLTSLIGNRLAENPGLAAEHAKLLRTVGANLEPVLRRALGGEG